MTSTEKNTIIHIGMPKAASTSLQQNFFARLPLINFTGGPENYNSTSNLAFVKTVHNNELYFDADKIREEITKDYDPALPIVLSKEFACAPFIPLSRGIPQSRTTIAKRFKALFPNAKILIIIRNQLKLQKSLYSEFYKHESRFLKSHMVSFKKWMELNRKLESEGKQNVFHFADFYSLITLYKSLFDEVKVVVFEEMIKDMHGFLENDLCEFIGIEANEAMPYYIDSIKNSRHTKTGVWAENVTRKIINFLQNSLGNPQKKIPIEKRKKFMQKVHRFNASIPFGKINPKYSEKHKSYLTNYYAEGNRKVSEMIGVDLEKYGYPVK